MFTVVTVCRVSASDTPHYGKTTTSQNASVRQHSHTMLSGFNGLNSVEKPQSTSHIVGPERESRREKAVMATMNVRQY